MFGSHYLYFLSHNLKSRFLGKREPLLAGFKVTHRCNLRCRACPFWRKTEGDIPYGKAVDVLHSLHQMGVRLLIFEGGEPFLWRDGERTLEDLIAEAKKLFFCVGVTTNGTLPLETNADTVWVSIDGLRESHNYNRGPTFDRIIENIRRSTHPRLLANITINRINVREIPELVRFLSDLVKGITIQFYYPYPGTEDLWVPWDERRWVLDELIRLKQKGYPLFDSYETLRALKDNRWKCHPWLIASADPDGTITRGCYLQNRAEIACEKCGFAAHTEISLAYDWHLGPINTGRKTFGFR
ncbi:MAG: hypothetical protein DRI61_07920 [Chloroflexi bacterium]|nr:MAG: hypothetical protein DRI61_07920 [Chloroflexota bacterium]